MFKRKAKCCLLFVYTAWHGSLKESQNVVIVCLSGRAGKFGRKAKILFIVCLSGRAGKFERQKVVYCLFIWQGQKVLKKGKKWFIVC